MKRSELEKHMGQTVTVTLFDGEVFTGELHKTGEKEFKNDPGLYLPQKWYFLIMTDPAGLLYTYSCLFRCSHVRKLKKGAKR